MNYILSWFVNKLIILINLHFVNITLLIQLINIIKFRL
jgi:hypothetical protein